MNWISPFLRPAPHMPRLPREQAQRLYPKMRWQILESTFIGYATFYFVRNNLPVVSREMGHALDYSKEQVGNMLAATAISYGVGKFFMGAWSDRSNPRYFMPLGLLLTALCNFAFGARQQLSDASCSLGAERPGAKHGLGAVRALARPLVQRRRARNQVCVLERRAESWAAD